MYYPHLFRIGAALGILILSCAHTAQAAPHVTVEQAPGGKRYLAYGDAPLFAFGPGDELRLLSGAADVTRWARWQREHGMNLVRAYPTSVPIEVYGKPGLHPFLKKDGKWDVDDFDDAYFENMAQTLSIMEEHGILVHLQLWQIVFFKGGSSRWDANYINPKNNINEWTRNFAKGNEYIDAPEGSPARAHQRRWVNHILDAVKDRGNVWIDVINELGNEMGTLQWAAEVVGWIRAWEAENGRSFLVGVDSEHHYVEDRFAPVADQFDMVILNELRNRDHALAVGKRYGLPVVSVRSSDGRNRWEDYMFANDQQAGLEHQTRYRLLCYRSLFSGLQAIGAYWKMEIDQADYKAMEAWPMHAQGLRSFWKLIQAEWPEMVTDDAFIVSQSAAPHVYGMRSETQFAVYLEAGSHTWNNTFEASEMELSIPGESPRVLVFHPSTADMQAAEIQRDGEILRIALPAFTDDLAVLIWTK